MHTSERVAEAQPPKPWPARQTPRCTAASPQPPLTCQTRPSLHHARQNQQNAAIRTLSTNKHRKPKTKSRNQTCDKRQTKQDVDGGEEAVGLKEWCYGEGDDHREINHAQNTACELRRHDTLSNGAGGAGTDFTGRQNHLLVRKGGG